MLSGYLITRILLTSLSEPHYYRRFYVRRTLRIFPLYYSFLAVLLIGRVGLAWLRPTWFGTEWTTLAHNQWWLWTYTSNILNAVQGMGATPYLAHIWSLAIEEQFYVFWPLVVAAAGPRRLINTCFALIGLTLAGRLWLWSATDAQPVVAYVLTPFRLDGFGIGAMLAGLHVANHLDKDRIRRAASVAGWLAAIFLALVFARHNILVWRLPEVRTLGYLATAILTQGDPGGPIDSSRHQAWGIECQDIQSWLTTGAG